MRTFITGATGFVGSRVVGRMAQSGHEMRCLVRRTSRTETLEAIGAEMAYGDVTDLASVREGMAGCDAVIHLANVYSFWEPDARIYHAVNVQGTRNVLECAADAGVSRVVHVSTAAIWGRPAECPFTEATPVGPRRFSAYARTKYAGDRIAWELHRSRGLPLTVIYPGVALGAGDPKYSGLYVYDYLRRLIPARGFLDSAFTYVHVADVAEAIVRALDKPNAVGEKYLVGCRALTHRAWNALISEISGVGAPRAHFPAPLILIAAAALTGCARVAKRPPTWGMSSRRRWTISVDAMRTMQAGFVFDGSKAQRELGLAYTPIRDALAEAIASCQNGV